MNESSGPRDESRVLSLGTAPSLNLYGEALQALYAEYNRVPKKKVPRSYKASLAQPAALLTVGQAPKLLLS